LLTWEDNSRKSIKVARLLSALSDINKCYTFYVSYFTRCDHESDEKLTECLKQPQSDPEIWKVSDEVWKIGFERGVELSNQMPINQDYMIVIELFIFFLQNLSGYYKGPIDLIVEGKWRRFLYTIYFQLIVDAMDPSVCCFYDDPMDQPSLQALTRVLGPTDPTYINPGDIDPEKGISEVEGFIEPAILQARSRTLPWLSFSAQFIPQLHSVVNSSDRTGSCNDEIDSDHQEREWEDIEEDNEEEGSDKSDV
jgi:hypothetical protein